MKYLIIILILFIGCTRKLILPAETDYPIIELVECGYTYDYPFLHVFKDTVHHQSQVYSFYPHKVYISINGGKAVYVSKRTPITVWSNSFIVTVTKNEYKHIYNFK